MSDDIDPISRIRYQEGVDPIEHAVYLVAIDLDIRELVLTGQVHPGVPIALLDQSDEAYARRIIGKLMDAGWSPPDVLSLRKEARP